MATATAILARARKELGYKENPSGSNRTKYGERYGLDGEPWCMMFIMWVFYMEKAENLLPCKTASCGAFRTAAKKAGNWRTDNYQPGDIMILTFLPVLRTPQHCGILEAVKPDGTLVILEGNTAINNQSNGGEVMRRERKPSCVVGAFRPAYEKETVPVKPKKHIALVAQECADGKGGWGTGETRKTRLKAAGYDPAAVQALVNALLKDGIRGTVTASSLTLRADHTTASKEKAKFRTNTVLCIKEIHDGTGASCWGRVTHEWETGKVYKGWVSMDYIRT